MNDNAYRYCGPSALLLVLMCLSPAAHAADSLTRIEQANAIYSSGDFAGSLVAARKLIEINPKSADAYTLAGLSALAMGDFAGAEGDLKKAFAMSPRNADVHNNLGLLYCKTNRESKALDLFEAAQKLDPARAERSLVNAAICASRMGDELRAENYLQIALKAKTPYAPAYYEMAHLRYRNGKFSEASESLGIFHQASRPSRESLMLAVLIAKADGKPDLQARYETQLAALERSMALQELPQSAKLGSGSANTADQSGRSGLVSPPSSTTAQSSANDLRGEQARLAAEVSQKTVLDGHLIEAQQSRLRLDEERRQLTQNSQTLALSLASEKTTRDNLLGQLDAGPGSRAELNSKIVDATRARVTAEAETNAIRSELSELNRKLAQLQSERQNAERALLELNEQNRATAAQFATEQTQVRQLNEEKAGQLARIAELRSKLASDRQLVAQNGYGQTAQTLELEQINEQLSQLTQERLRVQTLLAQTRQARVSTHAELELARAELQKSQREFQEAQNTNQALEQQLSLAKNQSASARDAISKAQSNASTIDEQIIQSRRATEAAKTEMARLLADVEQRRGLLAKANDEGEVLRSKISTVKIDIEQTRRNIASTKSETKNLSEESKVLAQNLATAQRQLAQANDQRSMATADLDKIKRGNNDLQAALDAARQQITDTQQLTAAAKQALGDAQVSDSQLRSRLAQANEQFAQAQKAYDQAHQGKVSAEEQIRTQEAQMTNLRRQEAELLTQRDQAVAKISQNKSQIIASQQSLTDLRAEVDQATQRYSALTGDTRALDEQVAKAKALLEIKRAALSELDALAKNNSSQLQNTQSSLKKTEDTLAQLNVQLVANTTKTTTIESDKQTLAGQIEQRRLDNAALEAQIAKLDANREEARKSFAQLQKRSEELQQLVSDTKISTEQQNAVLKQALADKAQLESALQLKAATAGSLSNSLKNLSQQRDKIQDQSARAMDEVQKLQTQINSIQTQITELSVTNQQKLAEVNTAKQELDKQKLALAEQQTQLASANKDLSDARNAKQTVEKNYAETTAAIQKSNQTRASLEQAVAKIQDQISSATTDASKNNEATHAKRLLIETLNVKLAEAKETLDKSRTSFDEENSKIKALNESVSLAVRARQTAEATLQQMEQQKAKLGRQLTQETATERTLSSQIAQTTQNISDFNSSIQLAKANQDKARAQIAQLESTKAATQASRAQESQALAEARARLLAATAERQITEAQLKTERLQRLALEQRNERLVRQQALEERQATTQAAKAHQGQLLIDQAQGRRPQREESLYLQAQGDAELRAATLTQTTVRPVRTPPYQYAVPITRDANAPQQALEIEIIRSAPSSITRPATATRFSDRFSKQAANQTINSDTLFDN